MAILAPVRCVTFRRPMRPKEDPVRVPAAGRSTIELCSQLFLVGKDDRQQVRWKESDRGISEGDQPVVADEVVVGQSNPTARLE